MISRLLTKRLLQADHRRLVMIIGARQTGRTTLLWCAVSAQDMHAIEAVVLASQEKLNVAYLILLVTTKPPRMPFDRTRNGLLCRGD